MTNKYDNVYIKDSYTLGLLYEGKGPLKEYFDKVFMDDLYYNEKSFEKAEIKILRDSIRGVIRKNNYKEEDIDLIISGDLQNQIAASDYAMREFNIPFMGIFNACATYGEGLIIAANFINNSNYKNIIVSTSSHNMVAERQFRNPTEYGAPKPDYATFTASGAVSTILTSKKSKVKITASTIGRVMDANIKDVNNMGAIMALGAADTIRRHLEDLRIKPDYYDLILTGDLGKYGEEILIQYMKKDGIDLSDNYHDCGTLLYDLEKQPVFAGGSGPVCSALVTFGYILKEMKKGKYKRVLYVPTGAIFSPTMYYQKETIPTISHAVSLEVM